MINSSLEWPFFSRREDFALALPVSSDLCVTKKFKTGFDAKFADHLLYFSIDVESLHPLSFLVPAMMPELIEEDVMMNLTADKITFTDQRGSKQILTITDLVRCYNRPSMLDAAVIKENLTTLHSNLKLFGRSSIVLALILGCNTEKNILSGAESIVLEPEPDLLKLISFVGAGDGLTPSFDDFLSGILFADRFLGINRIVFPKQFLQIIRNRTTIQSVQQLEFASTGKLSLRFEEFLIGLVSRKIKSAEIVKLLNFGHSSGTDILCGIWHYLNQH